MNAPRLSNSLLENLSDLSQQSAITNEWPDEQLRLMSEAGVLKWLVPRVWGGSGFSTAELVEGYLQLASACLVSTFVVTQRNAAILRLAGSENFDLQARLLPALCDADTFATVGISHLTTSRQHLGRPSVAVEEHDDGFLLTGFVPWVTGAVAASEIVTGGTLSDGRQILAVVKTNSPGVDVQPPAQLLALNASHTGAVQLNNVFVPSADIVAGPMEAVMKSRSGGGGAGGLTTSSLALGVAKNAIDCIEQEAQSRTQLQDVADALQAEIAEVLTDLRAAVSGNTLECGVSQSAESIRQRANSLVLRATQAHMAVSKGAGFSVGHPAERLVREAMFFLVWSCPQPVVTANLQELARR